MMRTHLSTRLESRTAFVGLLLVGALGLAGLLAWQAFDAGRSHARAVQKTLQEQARFAAWEYAGNARDFLDGKVLYPGLEVMALAGGKDPGTPLTLERVGEIAAEKDWPYMDGVTGVFRVPLDGGPAAFEGNDAEATMAWLADGLRLRVLEDTRPGWEPVMVRMPSLGGVFVYRLEPQERSEAERIYGFRLTVEGMATPLQYAFTESPLLPEGLTGDHGNGRLFHVTVRDASGDSLWASPWSYTSDVSATDTLGTRYAGLVAEVVVNPEIAPTLVIGGLPRSRLPLLVVLLLLTTGLVAGAFFQLRRETELAQLRADFVSGVSHELRTPLAQIRMFSETLLLGRVRNEGERRRSLEIIVNESQRLTHQVDNVLLYSRAERDGVTVDAQEMDLGRLVREVAEAFRPLAQAEGSRLELVAPESLRLRADGTLLRQALLNLLDNALKYGPDGQTVRLGGQGDAREVRIFVEDEGAGVPAEERERIWEPYFRLRAHRESSVAGSGIGLSVVREVAQAHGGTARVAPSDPGRGARLELALPAPTLAGEGGGRDMVRSRTDERVRARAPAALRRRMSSEALDSS